MSVVPQKPRILYCAGTLPMAGSGAMTAIEQHLFHHDDFTTAVVGPPGFAREGVPYFPLQRHPWIKRVSNTRFCRLVRQWEMTVEQSILPQGLEAFARQFRPDVILTIPDNTNSWLALLLSKRLGVPLVTNFQDWWPRNQFHCAFEKPYPVIRSLLERRFRILANHSQLIFCTSEGMMEKVGHPEKSVLLYPCPNVRSLPEAFVQPVSPTIPGRKFVVVYAGTLSASYGRMVNRLAHAMDAVFGIELRLFGPTPDWDVSETRRLRDAGTYRGQVPYEILQGHLAQADCLLAVMSFDREFETMMRTSFTTKILDYAQYAKLLLLWSPEWTSPARLIRKHNAGIVISVDDVTKVVTSIKDAADNTEHFNELRCNLANLASKTFNSEIIHRVFREGVLNVVKGAKGV